MACSRRTANVVQTARQRWEHPGERLRRDPRCAERHTSRRRAQRCMEEGHARAERHRLAYQTPVSWGYVVRPAACLRLQAQQGRGSPGRRGEPHRRARRRSPPRRARDTLRGPWSGEQDLRGGRPTEAERSQAGAAGLPDAVLAGVTGAASTSSQAAPPSMRLSSTTSLPQTCEQAPRREQRLRRPLPESGRVTASAPAGSARRSTPGQPASTSWSRCAAELWSARLARTSARRACSRKDAAGVAECAAPIAAWGRTTAQRETTRIGPRRHRRTAGMEHHPRAAEAERTATRRRAAGYQRR